MIELSADDIEYVYQRYNVLASYILLVPKFWNVELIIQPHNRWINAQYHKCKTSTAKMSIVKRLPWFRRCINFLLMTEIIQPLWYISHWTSSYLYLEFLDGNYSIHLFTYDNSFWSFFYWYLSLICKYEILKFIFEHWVLLVVEVQVGNFAEFMLLFCSFSLNLWVMLVIVAFVLLGFFIFWHRLLHCWKHVKSQSGPSEQISNYVCL